MREVTLTVYDFHELSKEAQDKAIDKYADINVDSEDWWEFICEDARTVGIEIKEFDTYRQTRTVELIETIPDIIESILEEHGKDCDTYKIALDYMKYFKELAPDSDTEELEDTFKHAIADAYLDMLRREYAYLTSEEAIIETLKVNVYEFTDDGIIY